MKASTTVPRRYGRGGVWRIFGVSRAAASGLTEKMGNVKLPSPGRNGMCNRVRAEQWIPKGISGSSATISYSTRWKNNSSKLVRLWKIRSPRAVFDQAGVRIGGRGWVKTYGEFYYALSSELAVDSTGDMYMLSENTANSAKGGELPPWGRYRLNRKSSVPREKFCCNGLSLARMTPTSVSPSTAPRSPGRSGAV